MHITPHLPALLSCLLVQKKLTKHPIVGAIQHFLAAGVQPRCIMRVCDVLDNCHCTLHIDLRRGQVDRLDMRRIVETLMHTYECDS